MVAYFHANNNIKIDLGAFLNGRAAYLDRIPYDYNIYVPNHNNYRYSWLLGWCVERNVWVGE